MAPNTDIRTASGSGRNDGDVSKHNKKGKDRQHAAHVVDPRFARLHTDPRFLRPNRDDSKVVLDERFAELLSDANKGKNRSQRRSKLDKYGRPVQDDGKSQSELQRLYRTAEKERDDDDDNDDENENYTEPKRIVDYARGEGALYSSGDEDSSDSDEESSEDEDSEANDGDVLIGSANARRKEAKRVTFNDEEDTHVSASEEDVPVEQLDIHASSEQLAELDAQAERTLQQEARSKSKRRSQQNTYTGDTRRLAAVNMDWDHIRAIDLYKVFSSVVSPAGTSRNGIASTSSHRHNDVVGLGRQIAPIQGRCLSVRIYPSEFGRKRMAKETLEGPPKAIFKSSIEGHDVNGSATSKRKKGKSNKSRQDDTDDNDDDDDDELFELDEGGDFDEEELRKYQLERLRYYYAIAEFDSSETARYILNAIDGSEMEHSANMFDLSFVPDDMTFPDWEAPKDEPDNEGWRDEATERQQHGNDTTYDGVKYTTDALRHSKVKLTWDADDPQRSKVTRQLAQKALTADQLRDDDFKAYLASASEESELDEADVDEREDEDDGDEGDPSAGRRRMRALLGLDNGAKGDDNDDSLAVGSFGKAKSGAFADGRKTRASNGHAQREGEMQITFMPGLSEAAERKKKGLSAAAKDADNETTLEKYKRKQKEKRERRKHRDSGDDHAKTPEGAIDSKDEQIGFDDPFFASDGESEPDFDAALIEERQKGTKNGQVKQRIRTRNGDDSNSDDEEENRRQLELIVDSEDDQGESGAGHFSLKDILHAEKTANGKKKGRWAKKKEKKSLQRGDNEVQPGFAIDVQDERFAQGLYGDHRFALDPSHPHFLKTQNTQQLLQERRKQEKARQRGSRGGSGRSKASTTMSEDAQATSAPGANDLSNLVRSVKKRNAVHGSAAPPHKKSKHAKVAV